MATERDGEEPKEVPAESESPIRDMPTQLPEEALIEDRNWPSDPDNAQNWSFKKRVFHTAVSSGIAMVT